MGTQTASSCRRRTGEEGVPLRTSLATYLIVVVLANSGGWKCLAA